VPRENYVIPRGKQFTSTQHWGSGIIIGINITVFTCKNTLDTTQSIVLSRHSPYLAALIVRLLRVIAGYCIRSRKAPNDGGSSSRKVSAPIYFSFSLKITCLAHVLTGLNLKHE
jgi:hypothetical protein